MVDQVKLKVKPGQTKSDVQVNSRLLKVLMLPPSGHSHSSEFFSIVLLSMLQDVSFCPVLKQNQSLKDT